MLFMILDFILCTCVLVMGRALQVLLSQVCLIVIHLGVNHCADMVLVWLTLLESRTVIVGGFQSVRCLKRKRPLFSFRITLYHFPSKCLISMLLQLHTWLIVLKDTREVSVWLIAPRYRWYWSYQRQIACFLLFLYGLITAFILFILDFYHVTIQFILINNLNFFLRNNPLAFKGFYNSYSLLNVLVIVKQLVMIFHLVFRPLFLFPIHSIIQLIAT